jgi:hypothetical protein
MQKTFILFLSFIFFIGCLNTEKQQGNSEKEYMEKGQQITAAVFSVLSSELQNAMQNGGVENALQYCNLNALNIVDSLSKVHQAKIRRASDKYRNPADQPTENESVMIAAYQYEIKEGKEILPKVIKGNNEQYHFYAPIYVNDLCLKCHGKIGEELTQENADLIRKYYPNDMATGYTKGDFRGVWSIDFEK